MLIDLSYCSALDNSVVPVRFIVGEGDRKTPKAISDLIRRTIDYWDGIIGEDWLLDHLDGMFFSDYDEVVIAVDDWCRNAEEFIND